MAQNFLTLSASYRRGTPNAIQKLDAEVATRLGASYKVPKGSQKRLLADLSSQWPDLTENQMNARVRVFRTAYALLSGQATTTHKEDARKKHGSAAGYLALKQDGIETWQQVEELLAQGEPVDQPMAANLLVGVSATHVIVRREELEALVRESVEARSKLDDALTLIEKLEQSLATLEPIAVEEVSLAVLAQSAASEATEPSPKPSVPQSELPTTSKYRGEGREVRYSKAFLTRLASLSEQERRRVVERIHWVTENRNIPGLRIKPLGPPKLAAKYGGKPLCARGTGDIRIAFRPNGQLEFLDILRKGDIPGTSEA